MSLTIKNWKKFQHFKDRRPPWIKLYRELLDDEEFYTLDPLAAKTLILLWLLASEGNGSIPSDMRKLAFRLRLSEAQVTQVMRTLLGAGFILESTGDYEQVTPDHIRKINGFGSRHIPDSIKRQVWERDLGKCQYCESVELLEYDHITPTSKGGESVFENIQLLCRSCNRKKRATTAEQVATPAQPWMNIPSTGLNMRNPETEAYKAEAYKEEGDLSSLKSDGVVCVVTDFDQFWSAYPRKVGKEAARKIWAKLKRKPPITDIITAIQRAKETEQWKKDGGQFIPHPATWLNQGRWADEPVECVGPSDPNGFMAGLNSFIARSSS